jgi:hypothetical protein
MNHLKTIGVPAIPVFGKNHGKRNADGQEEFTTGFLDRQDPVQGLFQRSKLETSDQGYIISLNIQR